MKTARLAPCCKAVLTLAVLLLLGWFTGGSVHARAENESPAPPPVVSAQFFAAGSTSGPLPNIKAVAAGAGHTCALTTGGGVKCWGDNAQGQLGDGTTNRRLTPVDVFGLTSGVQAITAGANHTCALITGGGVRCWGANDAGQLGDGATTGRLKPVDVSGLASVQALAAGDEHTCALTTGGGVMCWGRNSSGQLGNNTTADSATPVEVSSLTGGAQKVVAGGAHTCALTAGGSVMCWGDNSRGQLGDGTKTARPTPVDVSGLTSGVQMAAAGAYHTCALTAGGGVKCWGANETGQLGDSTTADRLTPVDVSGLTGAQAVAAGGYHTCALITGGGVKCWGYNGFGQLGDGTTTRRLTPVDVSGLTSGAQLPMGGAYHTCALMAGGGVKCWGDNQVGQLGSGGSNSYVEPVDVPNLTSGVQAVAAGGYHTCALTTGGAARCWGKNDYGQLGDGALTSRWTPADVSNLAAGAQAITAGVYHSCALTASGGAQCWGWNAFGQLGSGATTDSPTPVDVSGLANGVQRVTAGGYHTCALTTGGGVKCWGNNEDGQLGDGTLNSRSTPVDVSGLTGGVQMVAAGERHTCALTTGGGVQCWGGNEDGQLGDGTTVERHTPITVTGLISGGQMVATGSRHTCALTTGGGVRCWGDNVFGQLGDGTTVERHTPITVTGLISGVQSVTAGAYHTCALMAGGGVKCWGDNGRGQLGDGTTFGRPQPVNVIGLTSGVQAVAAGNGYTCALTGGGGLKCWGDNGTGQLGLNPGWTPLDVADTQPTAPPLITSVPITTAVMGKLYTYTVTATGIPTPTFSLAAAPLNMLINGRSGLIQWTPPKAANYLVTVRAQNGVEPPALQSFTIVVADTPVDEGTDLYLPLINR